jgi:hypothetical protein
LPEGFAEPRPGPEIPAFPTLRPRGFNSPGSGLPLGRNPQAHLVSFLDHAAFAVASILDVKMYGSSQTRKEFGDKVLPKRVVKQK